MADRIVRISEEVKKELSQIIREDIKDPRLPAVVSIVAVKVTKDLNFAKVYVSVLGDDQIKKEAEAALKSAAGFIRREIGHRLNLRNTPQFQFVMDDSIEYGVNMNKLIADVRQADKEFEQ